MPRKQRNLARWGTRPDLKFTAYLHLYRLLLISNRFRKMWLPKLRRPLNLLKLNRVSKVVGIPVLNFLIRSSSTARTAAVTAAAVWEGLRESRRQRRSRPLPSKNLPQMLFR